MEVFNIINPSITLSPYIKYYWTLKATNITSKVERIIPIGCVSLIFHKNNKYPSSSISGLTTKYTDIIT